MTNPTFLDLHPTFLNFREEVIKGLSQSPKGLPAQFLFHDQKGSDLFNRICETEDYYVTRTEISILQQNSQEIADYIGHNCLLIEYGSGSINKVYDLINSLTTPSAYMPIDIARDHLLSYAETTSNLYPDLKVVAVTADYTQSLELPEYLDPIENKLILFAGSTIGNLVRSQAIDLLQKSASLLNHRGHMLIGVDLKKDPNILHAAYNDREGWTAQFNLNVLTAINQELEGNFDVESFCHYAPYNPGLGRVEMHLISCKSQVVTLAGQDFHFREGESIHTENSHKYSIDDFKDLAQTAGFGVEKYWVDPKQFFGVFYLKIM